MARLTAAAFDKNKGSKAKDTMALAAFLNARRPKREPTQFERFQAEVKVPPRPTFGQSVERVMDDITAAGVGVNKAVAGAPGVLGDIGSLWGMGMDALDVDEASGWRTPGTVLADNFWNSDDTIGMWEDLTGKLPEPKGKKGQAIALAAELFTPTPGGKKKLTQAALNEISTRLPTAVKSTEDPFNSMLLADYDAFAKSSIAPHNAKLATQIPGLRVESDDWRDHADAYMRHATDNLNFLVDLPSDEVRARMGLWYDGANKIAGRLADKFGVPISSAAGAAAALSPQKDWFQNASLAERVGDAMFGYGDVPFSPDMLERLPAGLRAPKFEDMIKGIVGRRFQDLEDPLDKALWVRMFDEANFDRGYRSVLPEGDFGDFVRNQDGSPSKVAWGSLPEIAKAIGAYEAKGDVKRISELMGEKHKVRSFDNNIVEPDSDLGHVTADTHAVAANQLRPLSGNTPEVAQNFGNALDKKFWPEGGFTAAKSSSVDGLSGTYALNAEPYRIVGAQRGLKPRKVQSIAWEVGRSVFPDVFKTKANMAAVDGIWRQVEKGVMSANDARRKIIDLSGGFRVPDWFGHNPAADGGQGPATYKGPISGARLPRR